MHARLRPPNPTENAYLADIVTEALSRRWVLRAVAVIGLAGAASGTARGSVVAAPVMAAPSPADPPATPGVAPGLAFTPVAPNTADAVTVNDERFDHLYKFVSTDKVDRGNSHRARGHNLTLLDNGTLCVARLTGNSPAGPGQ